MYPDPSATARSTVLIGATTMKGILCRAAMTAALYVPIYSFVRLRKYYLIDEVESMDLVGSITVLCYPVGSHHLQVHRYDTKARLVNLPTAWMLWCWKRDPTMVSQIITDGISSVWSSRAVSLWLQC
jgi:hypothetical protein